MMRTTFFVILALGLSGCVKELGCYKEEALNYKDTNGEDDRCYWASWGRLYWDSNTYQDYFQPEGIDYIKIYVDGQYLGEDSASNYGSSSQNPSTPSPLSFSDTIYYEEQAVRITGYDG